MNKLTIYIVVGLLGLLLTGCMLVNYSSSDSFILKGSLEPNVGLELSPQYRPVEGSSCMITPLSTGQPEARKGAGWKDINIKPAPHNQTFAEKIPLYVTVRGCHFEFDRVYTVISYTSPEKIAPYTKTMNFLWTDGIAAIKQTKMSITPVNCSWRFKIGSALEPDSDIQKSLNCTALSDTQKVAENTPIKQLPIFILNINILDEMEPSTKDTWVKVPTGWKSCINTKNPLTDGFCTTPPKFRTFKHNGKTCTVYPSCTE